MLRPFYASIVLALALGSGLCLHAETSTVDFVIDPAFANLPGTEAMQLGPGIDLVGSEPQLGPLVDPVG